MTARSDPADLGRGLLTRWLPVFWQAPEEPPQLAPFVVTPGVSAKRFLLRVILSARTLSFPAAGFAVLQMVGESLVPVVMGLTIDRALATGAPSQLVFWLVVLGLNFVVMIASGRLAQQLTVYATQRVQHRLRATLSRTVLHPTGVGQRQIDGSVVSVMTNDVMRLSAVGLGVFPVGEFVAIVFIAVSLLLISWPLGLVALIGAPIVVWLMGVLSGKLARDSRVYQTLLAQTVGRATDLVTGYRVIKGVRAESEATRRYRHASQETLAGAHRNLTLLGRFISGSSMVSGVFVAAIAGMAGVFAVNGQLSVGGLIAAVGLTQALLPNMSMLAMNAVPAWAAAVAASGRVLDALNRNPSAENATLPNARSGFETPTLSLTMSDGRHILVSPGDLVGVRADDSMASAIAEALLSPGSTACGVEVAVDGEPAAELGHAAYRSRVVVAPHHATLFSGTISANLDTPGASMPSQQAALWAAACEDFVAREPGGQAAEVGEMGNRLSGGQRQRVALARALARDAPVLVLHDPTTAVDSVTEAAIADRLRSIRRGKSTVILASSPALLAACDKVVDLRRDNGAQEDTGGTGA